MIRLTGVGVGPGDPELVTVQGVRVLREADEVLVPVLDTGDRERQDPRYQRCEHGQQGEQGRAELVVRSYVDADRVRRVPFALNERGGRTDRRTEAWDRAAAAVTDAFDAGAASVAFATIGDPNIYSTFTYLARTVRDLVPAVRIDTVPGVTAMQDLAARSGTVLVEGREALTLVPLTDGLDRLSEALETGDTVVAYKCGSRMPDVRTALEETGRVEGGMYGAKLGLPDEDVRPVREVEHGEQTPYLSTVIATRSRPERGGNLR